MNSVRAALAQPVPSEVRFDATVTSAPRFFFGARTHATHEIFHVRSDDGVALDVIDNVALAPRVPVRPGDRIEVQGELVPAASRGPLVHWTHHDPRGIHPGGFIDWNGRRYA
jgi:hypothetical protein